MLFSFHKTDVHWVYKKWKALKIRKIKLMLAMCGHMNVEIKPPSLPKLECLCLHLEI